MAWWNKYKGVYRLRCDLDLRFNDYPREKKKTDTIRPTGKLIDNDVYISCSKGRVYWVDRGMYEAWVGDIENGSSKIGTGNNIIKKMKKDIIEESIIKGDGELTFRFKENVLPQIVTLMGGDYQSAIDRSPFSSKNLVKEKYEIPKIDLDNYNNVKEELEKSGKKIKMKDYSNIYLTVVKEHLKWDIDKFDMESKLQKLKGKEFIHKLGLFDEMLEVMKTY